MRPQSRRRLKAESQCVRSSGAAARLSGVVLALVAGGLSVDAQGSLVKPNGSPPIDQPNTLGLEIRPSNSPTRNASATSSVSNGRCGASAVRLAHLGVRILTAKHCATEVLDVFDERHHVVPTGRFRVGDDVDLALLEVHGALPWQGLEPRRLATLQVGERLCAWRFERGPSGLERQRICGRFVRLVSRSGAPPLIELNHPYPRGTSGSALVDREGRIAGVVVASNIDSGLAEPIDSVLAWDEAAHSAARR